MKHSTRIFVVFLLFTTSLPIATKAQTEQGKAESFLEDVNTTLTRKGYEYSLASWAFNTNITDYNAALQVQANLAYNKAYAEIQKNALQFDLSKLKEDTARQIKFLRNSTQLKDQTELREVAKLRSELRKLYSTAKVGNNSLSPGLVRIMAQSRDYNKLLNTWWGWRNASGRKMRDIYKRYVDLRNKGARENGYTDLGQAWRLQYEVSNLDAIVEELWNDLRPLYLELHAYVRYRLTEVYPGKVSQDDHIDAHLLGNMWAQNWVNIYKLVEPYKNKSSLDVTANLKKDTRYNTPIKLTKLAESFFHTLGLIPVPASFYEKSLLQRPKDREVVCHASAWDFSLYKDVR
jgi:peptidyl-dipeptidase A